MELEQLSYIGELVSAFVVIVSVLYLAVQIRQHTNSIKQSNVKAISDSYLAFLGNLYKEPELTEIYLKGLKGLDQLNEIEKARFIFLTQHLTRIFFEYFSQYKYGGLDADVWLSTRNALLDLLSQKGYVECFELRRHWYPDDFQEYFNDLINESQPSNKGEYQFPK